MPLGPELVVVGALAAAVIVLLVVLGPFKNRFERSGADTRTVVVSERGDAWLGRVATGLSGLAAHRVEWPSPTTLQLYWTRRPVWTFVVAVLLFPFGLVALLVTTTLTGTFRIVETGPPANVQVAGDFSRAAVDLINRAIPS